MAGGIYVHNWFTIDAAGFDEFVKLSGEAWPDFERRFEAKIFGLFAAEPRQDDLHGGRAAAAADDPLPRPRRMAEEPRSRPPRPCEVFARRRELTRVSLARSCVLIPTSDSEDVKAQGPRSPA